jgi:hypothetical protein
MNTFHWTDSLDQTTSDFIRAFGDLNKDQLNWKPNPAAWSVGQNIDHLIIINRTYFDVIKRVRDGQRSVHWLARFGFMVNFFGKFILKSVQPDRRRKIKTFSIWEPTTGNIESDILEKFVKHQEELKTLIRDSKDLLDKGVIISSPASNVIVYKLETAFDIIVTHERRHLEQAKELLARLI